MTIRRIASSAKPLRCQGPMCQDHPLCQLITKFAGGVVIQKRNDVLDEIPFARFAGCDDLVRKYKHYTRIPQFLFSLYHVDGILWTCIAIALEDEHVRYGTI